MIKHINHQNVTTTPFVAAKARVLSNIQNNDVVSTEPAVYGADSISLDYIDYNSGDPIINNECNVALEQQDLDALGYEEGITGSAKFNPDTDPRNEDGSYKTLVHRTVKNAFYNTYRNPTEIFGVEHIDFPLSKTLRNLSDKFRLFNIPRLTFGEKIQPNSVRMYDNLFDDNVFIFDDGYQNLIAGYNLFSRVQEIRSWPEGTNPQVIITGSITSSCICPTYGDVRLTNPSDVTTELNANITFQVSASGTPRPIFLQWYYGSTPLTDGGRISGSTGPVLYINNVQNTDAGNYRVMAHNSVTSATSSYALLTVILHPPLIISQPRDQYVYKNFTASFEVTASGTMPMTYQWYSGSTLLVDTSRLTGSYLVNGSGSHLQFNNCQLEDSSSDYHVVVSNIAGTVTSNPASLTVWDNVIYITGSDTASVTQAFRFGSTYQQPPYVEQSVPLVSVGLQSGSVWDSVTTFNPGPGETSSVVLGFENGYLFDALVRAYGNDTASITLGFDSGYILDTLYRFNTPNSEESASLRIGFEDGYITTTTTPMSYTELVATIGVGLASGSVSGSAP